MGNKVDYHILIQKIMFYLIVANEYFWETQKNKYSIWLIPNLDSEYTNPLKALWYHLLDKKDNLVLISKWQNKDKILASLGFEEVFMGKKRWKATKIIDILGKSSLVELIAHKFAWIDREIPFVRIISDYKNIIFLEIGKNVSKVKATNLLLNVSKHSNIMFISDLNSAKTSEDCDKINLEMLKSGHSNNKNLFIVDLFLRLMKKVSNSIVIWWYLNNSDLINNKNKEFVGFWTLLTWIDLIDK